MNDDHLITELRKIALRAGAAIMRHYQNGTKVMEKDDNSPVTAADHEAEAIILEGLRKLTPDIPIVSEEAAAAGHVPEIGKRFFLVDPLDGTREFINGNGEFTVNIALIEDRVPVLGVVYAPAIRRMFFTASRTKAAHQEIAANEAGDLTAGAPAEPIAVRKPSPEGLDVVASRSHRDKQTDEYLALYKIREFKAAGSSLKFCLVASGEADLYPRHGRTMEWDTAAGHAVLNAAGGSVTGLDGSPFLYGKIERGLDNPYFVARGGA